MVRLPESANAWASDQFLAVLKHELEALPVDQLPLQDNLQTSSHLLDDKPSVLILGVDDDGEVIHARIGVFYNGIVAGCSCADDPTPVEPVNEYCELSLELDKQTGMASVSTAE